MFPMVVSKVMRGHWLTLAALGTVAVPGTGIAQTPAQRTLLEAFRDSLQVVTDSIGLARVEASMVANLRQNRASPMQHLRLGFLGLRQAELGAIRYYEDAAAEFQSVTRLAPGWPYGWFGLGLAEFGLVRSTAAQRASTSDPFAKAAVALARAAALDGRFADLVVEEAFQGRRERQAPRVAVMLAALRVASQPRAANPMILAGLGRLEREFGDPTAALHAFEAWLPLAGRQRGLAQLEIARTRFLIGRGDGSGPYFEGAVSDDSLTLRAYRSDIAPIASDDELRRFDRTGGPARAAWLERFWAQRDAADLRRPGERLREHYRRLYFARRVFPLYLPGPPADRIAAADLPVDDRGLVFIRHGEPDDRVQLSAMGVEPNESWRFDRDEGDLVIHFVARHDPDVYRLVESLLDVADAVPTIDAPGTTLVSQSQEALLRSREQISPVYRRDRRTTPERGRDFLLAERAMSRASLRAITTTDSYRHRFAHPLGARIDLAVLSPATDSGRLHVAVAAPFAALGAAWLGHGLAYPLRVRLSAFTPEGDIVAAVDTTVRPVTWERQGERWLAGTMSVPVPSGQLRVRVAVSDGDSVGTVLALRTIEVGSEGPIALSDLAIGAAGLPWRASTADGEEVTLLPLGVLRRNEPAAVAYEVAAPLGATVRSQIILMRADEEAGVISSQHFDEAFESGRGLVRHVLDLDRLKPGLYRVEVTVSDGRGGLARRWRAFELY